MASPTRDIHSPKTIVTSDLYSTLKKDTKSKQIETKNDYYYDKENELYTRKKDRDRELTLSPPRDEHYNNTTSTSYVTKSFGGDTSYPSSSSTTKNRNNYSPVSSPVHVMHFIFIFCFLFILFHYIYCYLLYTLF